MAVGWKKMTKVPVAAPRDVADWYASARYQEIIKAQRVELRQKSERFGYDLACHMISGGVA
jgi:hypothetical protein